MEESETLTKRTRSFESKGIGGLAPVLPNGSMIVRGLKQVVLILAVSAIILFASSPSLTRQSEAAGAALDTDASVKASLFSAPQGQNKFDHAMHSQLACDQCHVRKADTISPLMPGHRACISCHIKEFTSTQFGICSNCHEGINAPQPKVLAFPKRQTFGVEFSHVTHVTYVSGDNRSDCSSCHRVTGARTTFPGHRECYICHKTPDQVKAGEKVGGASCGQCHSSTADKKPPSAMSKAYNYRFTHQAHVQREGINCSVCHKVLGENETQVSLPQLKEHRGGGFQGCGSCHNGRRAFGGELVNNACARCHGRNMM